jgi:hypothetical protein
MRNQVGSEPVLPRIKLGNKLVESLPSPDILPFSPILGGRDGWNLKPGSCLLQFPLQFLNQVEVALCESFIQLIGNPAQKFQLQFKFGPVGLKDHYLLTDSIVGVAVCAISFQDFACPSTGLLALRMTDGVGEFYRKQTSMAPTSASASSAVMIP